MHRTFISDAIKEFAAVAQLAYFEHTLAILLPLKNLASRKRTVTVSARADVVAWWRGGVVA